MQIHLNGLYLDRLGRRVGITRDRGADQRLRWVTTRGHYVTSTGRASLAGGDTVVDLVADITTEQDRYRSSGASPVARC